MVDAIALRWFYVALSIPFVFSSNGDGFIFHDRTGASAERVSRPRAWRRPRPPVPNDRLRHMLIGYARVAVVNADGVTWHGAA